MPVVPMNQQGDSAHKDISTSSARLCWVLNRDSNPYSGTFRGVKITIPANLEKIGKRAEAGGNLMPYLDACRFVRDLKEPQGFTTDNAGRNHPVIGPKMLFEKELSAEEFTALSGGNYDFKKESAKEERKARQKLAQELAKIPNKLEVSEDDSPED